MGRKKQPLKPGPPSQPLRAHRARAGASAHRPVTLGSPPKASLAVKDGLFRFARLPAAAAPRLQMRSVHRQQVHLHLHLLRSPSHPVACTAQVVRPAPIRSSSPRCSPRQSLQCRRQVSCPFPGEKYGTPRHPNLLSTPQVRASDLFDLTLNELSGFAAQAPDPVLQHVRRQTDGIHG